MFKIRLNMIKMSLSMRMFFEFRKSFSKNLKKFQKRSNIPLFTEISAGYFSAPRTLLYLKIATDAL